MLNKAVRAIFGSKNDRDIKRLRKLVVKINEYEAPYRDLTDDDILAKTADFKARYQKNKNLDELLPEAFALVREAADRTLGMRHFDVQFIGGITLHEGHISEMRTGEGKTLMSTLPAYLNALTEKGVHIVTVNDYLASRDAKWMEPVYNALGMNVGVIYSQQPSDSKKAAYAADITYGTNNEFGFDYLRDNMAFRLEDRNQRERHYAIIDEVDSILIDEARTPLIISGQAEDSSELYRKVNMLIPSLTRQVDGQEGEATVEGDFIVDEKTRQVELTEQGHQKIEELLTENGLLEGDDSLYATTNLSLLHHVNASLRAYAIFKKDVDYMVRDDQVMLIDEHTGRPMPGRRLSEGLHQAIEAKEGVSIQNETQTMASTTFQNYFRLYDKLSGMTGTADTEAFEFRQIYGLDVIVIPTNKPIARKDLNDLIYFTLDDKFDAIAKDIEKYTKMNAPVLVGTASVESSEEMSRRLKAAKIDHKVLNAKFHEKEAEIVAQAGRPGSVTIATNMAGRGTDIVLGGNLEVELSELDNPSDEQVAEVKAAWKLRHDQVLAAGGLHILGTERHESRRIDNQLRGRAGRQGDPGLSRFYLSMDDNLMRIFMKDGMRALMRKLGSEGEAIEHKMVSNAIEKAQRKVEGRNFDIRKQLLEYDDVANEQRQIVYQQRNDLLEANDIREIIDSIRIDVVEDMLDGFIPKQTLEEQWDIPGLEAHLNAEIGLALPIQQWLDDDDKLHEQTLRDKLLEHAQAAYDAKLERIGEPLLDIERQVMLQVLDTQWKEHLANMDHLRQSIGLRSYAQKNPKQEYKRESFELFQSMLSEIKRETIKVLARVELVSPEEMAELEAAKRAEQQKKMKLEHAEVSALEPTEPPKPTADDESAQPFVREGKKVGRNEPCPCGSGLKYKKCHGKVS